MGSRQRVLIIDEDRRTVDKLQEKFLQIGFEAEIALTPEVGMAIVAERYMSVALLSARLGQDAKWELVKKLKEFDPHLPVVLFNGPKVKGLSKEARRAGVSKFILTDTDTQSLLSETMKVARN